MHVIAKDNVSAIYHKINEYLSNGHAVIYAAELETSLSAAQISSNLQQTGIIGGIEHHIKTGALTILNKEKIYSLGAAQLDIQTMSGIWIHLVEKLKRKSRFKRFLVILGTSSVSEAAGFAKLVEYEQRITETLVGKKAIQVICCYLDSSIKKMPLTCLIRIIAAHQSSMHYHEGTSGATDWLYRQWQPSIILELIQRETEKTLGSGANYLIFRTLKLIYKIKEDAIVSQPEVFEEKLQKIIGKGAARSILESVAKEIRKQLLM